MIEILLNAKRRWSYLTPMHKGIWLSCPGGVSQEIYKSNKINLLKYKKLMRMMTKAIDCDGICFPIALVHNSKDEFVGYLMKKACGKELQKSVFQPVLFKKYFPAWTKKDCVQLCITILEKICYLHDRNVIIGDINPNNILVASPTEIYFVDTDSYQIEGFPCPVGTINFTAPEIQGKKYTLFLRSFGNERFAVATLLFMIMLPGKTPYAIQGGENQIENIKKGDFAYPLGGHSNKKTPAGPWRFCWSHMPYFIKSYFYKTFRKGEAYYNEADRLSAEQWLKAFEYYLKLIENGTLEKQDAMSLEIFPTRLKNHSAAAAANAPEA